MPRSQNFEPGEIAVLLHGEGGRIMVVHEVTKTGVFERASTPDQQQYRQPLRFHEVLKVESPEKAYELVGRFKQIEDQRRRLVAEIDAKAKNERERAVNRYEIWEPEQ